MELLLRIFVAMILGMLIGNERKNRMKSAGMRTHALVALGAALMMVVSKYGFSDTVQGDGARLAAQVVSGVGFLGAGTIVVTHRNQIKGLTTAAGLWASAGVGLALGIGFYEGAIIAAIGVYLILAILQRLDSRMHKKILYNTHSQHDCSPGSNDGPGSGSAADIPLFWKNPGADCRLCYHQLQNQQGRF